MLGSAFPGRPWGFVWSGERCTKDVAAGGIVVKGPKKLSKVWANSELRRQGWTKESTLIVEDTPANCKHNWGNSIIVKTFDVSVQSAALDCELQELCTYLDTVADHRANGGSLRKLDKRAAGW